MTTTKATKTEMLVLSHDDYVVLGESDFRRAGAHGH